MKKALTVLAFILVLSPNLAFASATVGTNAQYISFLRQELAQLEAELLALQTEETVSSTSKIDQGAVMIPTNTIEATTTEEMSPVCKHYNGFSTQCYEFGE